MSQIAHEPICRDDTPVTEAFQIKRGKKCSKPLLV